jgi:hypothetical protein
MENEDGLHDRVARCVVQRSLASPVLTGNSSADFTVVQIWTCTGAADQKWNVPA